MVKTRSKANLIRGLGENEGLATQLAIYQTRYGDWRELFRSVDRIDKVTKADIRRVANDTFQDTNRTVGVIETVAGVGPGGEQGSQQAPSGQAPSDQPVSDQRGAQ
jgi:predicted Zn-dependent peptidase